uniref:Putative egg cell-secreted protein 1.4 n=1 Tax=Davidia involucrata TaxID=16924 RepID=A0A5B7AAI3_DAVIN
MALKCVILLLAIACFMATANSAGEPPLLPPRLGGFNQLTARLETDARFADCWKALREIKSCASEILLFLTRRVTVIHPPCCRAIVMITNRCWAALGFTTDETDMLKRYCGQSSFPPPIPNSL